MSKSVFIVLVTAADGYGPSEIHSVYNSEEKAIDEVDRLSSVLGEDSTVTYEEHEEE